MAETPGPPPPEVTKTVALAWLDALEAARPDYVRGPVRAGCRRGIDVLRPEVFRESLRIALRLFVRFHGRLPDLVHDPLHVDHFFGMKFFGHIPMPNPADKLLTAGYVPPELGDAVILTERPHISDRPVLPPDDAVPPGRYFLKLALGSGQQSRLPWPPAPGQRPQIESALRRALRRRYGVAWGEWWYALGPTRWFLEADLSERIAPHPEWRIYVRRGSVRMAILIHYWHEDREKNHQRIIGPDMAPLPGRTRGRSALDCPLPQHTARFFEIAAAMGRRFDMVRVDFMDVGEPRPVIGELTLCDANARRLFVPESFNRTATELLFGPAPGR